MPAGGNQGEHTESGRRPDARGTAKAKPEAWPGALAVRSVGRARIRAHPRHRIKNKEQRDGGARPAGATFRTALRRDRRRRSGRVTCVRACVCLWRGLSGGGRKRAVLGPTNCGRWVGSVLIFIRYLTGRGRTRPVPNRAGGERRPGSASRSHRVGRIRPLTLRTVFPTERYPAEEESQRPTKGSGRTKPYSDGTPSEVDGVCNVRRSYRHLRISAPARTPRPVDSQSAFREPRSTFWNCDRRAEHRFAVPR